MARLQAILAMRAKDVSGAEQSAEAVLLAAIAADKALAAEVESIDHVERLVRYHRDLAILCNNFVNFKDFYDGGVPAVFQCGTLFLDQRECHLCMRVDQCDVDPGFESCPCDETLPEFCAAEWYDVTDCFDQTSCTDLQTFDGPCWALLEHAYLKCLYGEDGCDEDLMDLGRRQHPGGSGDGRAATAAHRTMTVSGAQ